MLYCEAEIRTRLTDDSRDEVVLDLDEASWTGREEEASRTWVWIERLLLRIDRFDLGCWRVRGRVEERRRIEWEWVDRFR